MGVLIAGIDRIHGEMKAGIDAGMFLQVRYCLPSTVCPQLSALNCLPST
jgi:hypothetical protein